MASRHDLRIEPADTLDFPLASANDDAPQLELKLTNLGADDLPMAFKVKTTKPRRFLVRPNQGVVQPGTTETVRIILLAQERRALLEEFWASGEKDATNKFLVQSLAMTHEQHAAYRERSATEQANELTELWVSTAGERTEGLRQKKLKVAFGYPVAAASRLAGSAAASAAAAAKSPYDAAENVRGEVAARAAVISARNGGNGGGGAASGAGAGGGAGGGAVGGPQLWDELRMLRKKYDDLVAFTVNLTAEKDLIQRSLDATKEDLQRESRLRRQLESRGLEGTGRKAGAGGRISGANDVSQGFSLLHVMLAAMVAFLIGQYVL